MEKVLSVVTVGRLALLLIPCACADDPNPSVRGAPATPFVPRADETTAEVFLRFVEEDPQVYPPGGAVAKWKYAHATGPVVNEWSLGGDRGLQGWELNDLELVEEGPDSAHLRHIGPRSFVWLGTELDAEDVYTVEVELAETPGVSLDPFASSSREVRLTWIQAGSPDPVRRPFPPSSQEIVDGDRRIRFFVGGHPRWRGKIERVQVHFTGDLVEEEPEPTRLARITFMGMPSPSEGPPTGQVGKFVIGGVARNGIVGGSRVPIERELTLPPNASLRFAYGMGFAFGASALFRVEAELDDGETRELFADRWGAESLDSPETPEWSRAELDLGELAGRTVRLRLVTEHDQSTTPRWGLPVWGHPEVLIRGAVQERPNVILISIDTLRADRLSAYGYERETSPNIAKWARSSGVLFRNTIAAAAWTLPTHLSMMTGSNALEHGVHLPPVPSRLVTLAERLRAAGYSTMAVTGGVVLTHEFGFVQGFDAYYCTLAQPAGALEDELDRATTWLEEERGRPFFLFFHTYEVHDPFHARQPYFETLGEGTNDPGGPVWISAPSNEVALARAIAGRGGPTPFRFRAGTSPQEPIGSDDRRMISDAYDSGIAYMDTMIGGLFERIRSLGLEDSTVIVLTSDHGEGLGEHGEYRHRTLYDEILRVPLIISGPGVPRGAVVEHQVRQVDVTPTLLDLVGLSPQDTGSGRSLRALMQDPAAAFEEMAWSYAPTNYEGLSLRIGNRQKYIVNDAALEALRGRERLFDLKEDPHEEDADHDAPEYLRAAARDMLLRHWHGMAVSIQNSEPTTLHVRIFGILQHARMRSAVFGESPAKLEGETGVITLPPDSSWFGLWLGPDPLTLEGGWGETLNGGEEEFELRIDPLTFREPKTIGWRDGEWVSLDEGAELSTRIRVEVHGNLDEAEGGTFVDDPAVLDQLRALGYVR